MKSVTSADGTVIAYEQQGSGPALILVDGAMSTRGGKAALRALLAPQLTVFGYDRRGRGDSGDTRPYAVDREIEDIQALIEVAGGTAALYGHSSGAALALDAALQLGGTVTKIAMYEAPYNDDPALPAPAAREDLSLDHGWEAQLLHRGEHLRFVVGELRAWDGNAVLRKELLSLVLEEPHERVGPRGAISDKPNPPLVFPGRRFYIR